MHADLTRRTFDPALGFRSVVMQQGRVLLDAEWNEQAEIAAHHDQARAADIIGPAGGPASPDGGPGPFALVDLATGQPPSGQPWDQLGVVPGHYYVDGVLAEAQPHSSNREGAWQLREQPFLATAGGTPGLAEPGPSGRYAAWLYVFDHLVTPDDRPELLESALGGPDTANRAQTVWQVRVEAMDGGESCSEAVAKQMPLRPLMTAMLEDSVAAANACDIATGGGYQLLENQLYRVEVHDIQNGTGRFLWSRENGSVVAGLTAMETAAGVTTLIIDRSGRDEQLSIHAGDLIEVTSTDLRLRREPGHLAIVNAVVNELALQVTWSTGTPPSMADIGRAPIVRRWDGGPDGAGPFPLGPAPQALEGGVTVRFSVQAGDAQVGDYWLIPARTVRLAYGVKALAGTLEWPRDGAGRPLELPPTGPDYHRAPLGVLENAGGVWRMLDDCRKLFPPLTSLASIDLVGGDGQEGPAGAELDEPVRVVVRKGGLPVVGELVQFTAAGGTLREAGTLATIASPGVVKTGPDGVAAVRWTLNAAGPTTQTLTVQRLDGTGNPTDVAVVATARISRDVGSTRTPGMHITGVFVAGRDLLNDSRVFPHEFEEGIQVDLDDAILPESVIGKPVGRLLIEVPFPMPQTGAFPAWPTIKQSFGTHRVEINGFFEVKENIIFWRPSQGVNGGIAELLKGIFDTVIGWRDQGIIDDSAIPILMRFQLDGWAILSSDQSLRLNTHVISFNDNGQTLYQLPTDDDVTGGVFDTWFWLELG